ncbi:heat shock protein 30 [Irpex lacteus]|nr:heat shock protein 30 [Irpex lacteus]
MGSVDTNPPNATIHISNHGTDWLWAVFAVMTASMLGMFLWSFMRPKGTRFFHNIALIILTTSAIAYFAMASDLGATPITTEFRAFGTRQIWYVRYIQWFINFPLLLVTLLFATGLALSDVLTTAFFAWVVVITGLVGALVQSSYKWGFYVFGLIAMIHVWTTLLGHGPRSNFSAGPGLRSGYIRGSGFVSFLLLLYPICWACSEGANVISPTSEAVWYGILDLLLGPVFLMYFLFGLRNVDYAAFGLQSWKYSDSAVVPGVMGPAVAERNAGVLPMQTGGPGIVGTQNVPAAGAQTVPPVTTVGNTTGTATAV